MTSSHPPTTSLWSSDIPHHGRILGVVVLGERAAVLDDLNGNGREVELRLYDGSSGRWQLFAHQDDIDVPSLDGPPAFGWLQDDMWAVGLTRPATRVEVTANGESVIVTADDDGWWLTFLPMPAEEHRRDPSIFKIARGPRVRIVG